MWVYLIMILPAVLFARFAGNAKEYPALKSTYCFFAVLSFLPLVFVAALRGEVGTDWTIYNTYYYEISNGGRRFSEPLFNVLNEVLYVVSPNSALLFAVVSFITLLLFFIRIYQDSEMPELSILLFFVMGRYFGSLNQIRQMLAISIFFFAWKYIRERKAVKYYLLILTACMIHSSSVIFIPLYFLYRLKCRADDLLRYIMLYILCLPFIMFLSPVLVRLTPYSWYLDSRFSGNGFDLLGFCVAFIMAAIHLILLKRLEIREMKEQGERTRQTHELGFMTMICVLSCLFYLLTNTLPQVTRIAEGYSVLQILSIANLAKREENEGVRRLLICAVVFIFGCKLLYNVYITKSWYGVLPYETFLKFIFS